MIAGMVMICTSQIAVPRKKLVRIIHPYARPVIGTLKTTMDDAITERKVRLPPRAR